MGFKSTEQKEAPELAYRFIANWPLFAPTALATILISVPMLPLLASTINSQSDPPLWIQIGFLLGPGGLVLTGILALVFRRELFLSESNRMKYYEVEIRGKNLKPYERTGTLSVYDLRGAAK